MKQQFERSPSESYFWPVVLAVVLHVLIFAMLFVSWAFAPELPPSKPIVQATLYQLKSKSQATTQTNQKIAGEAKKTASKQYEVEQLEQKKLEQQKLEQQKLEQQQVAAAKAAEQKKADEARKAEAQKAAEAKKADEAKKAAEAKAAEQKKQADIANASVSRSSGDKPFDSSAVAAVRNVGRIPEMQQLPRATFDSLYRQRRIIFKPEDLSL